MKILYCDCYAGISGDMTVAAMLGLGLPLDHLRQELAKLPLPLSSYHLDSEQCQRRGITASRFTVKVEEHQPHRHYTDIAGMIERSSLAAPVKERAQRIFFRLAEAEATVHGVEIGQVHFHEVGAVDSIIDIVAIAIALDYLGIEEIYASALPLGSGSVETAHGRLPVPTPATAELLRGIPVHSDLGEGERVTPTGAAFVAALCTGFGAPPPMTVTALGYGAGNRDYPDIPNVLRLFLGGKSVEHPAETVYVLETHIDDSTPETLGFLMERLLAEGALDAAFSPLQMKKNRPAVRLTVITPPEKLQHLAHVVLNESSASGLRYQPAARMTLERSTEERQTSLGRIRVKVFTNGGEIVRVTPEFEDCRRIALEQGIPLTNVYRVVERETLP